MQGRGGYRDDDAAVNCGATMNVHSALLSTLKRQSCGPLITFQALWSSIVSAIARACLISGTYKSTEPLVLELHNGQWDR